MSTGLSERSPVTYWRSARHRLTPAVPRRSILTGDALTVLRTLPTASIDCCISSPPFYLLRNYGVSGQIGLEDHVDAWVEQLRAVVAEIGRVLKPQGALWLCLGDSFSRGERYGAPAKSLLLGPERLVMKLVADGWVLRNKVIWAKPNPMPNSVRDRLNATHEVIYLLVRSRSYHFDLDAIRRPARSPGRPSAPRSTKYGDKRRPWAGPLAGSNIGLVKARAEGRLSHPLGANPGDVWSVATAAYRGAHFATFPERLIERPLLTTCPLRVCIACGAAWRVVRDRNGRENAPTPACECDADWQPGLVLDGFFGSGTVGLVAEAYDRDWLGIELNPDYVELATQRIESARTRRRRP